jgi:hypothetical protein
MGERFIGRFGWIFVLASITGCNTLLDNTPGELVSGDAGDATPVATGGGDATVGVPNAGDAGPPSGNLDATVFDASAPVDTGPLSPAPDASSAPTCAFGAKECNGACVQITDPAYGCGPTTCAACAIPHATAACAASGCAIGACDPGYADCDQNPANGCETDLSQTGHCGTCNAACPSAAPDCAPAAGGFACSTGCGAGAPTLCGSQCVSLTTSLDHCGACGNACPVVSNGEASCNAGVCGFACHADFHACGQMCASDVSPATCGTSCAPCPTEANAIATCNGAACGIACEPGFADCNGLAADGCEVSLLGDSLNCGKCGVSCSGRACTNGVCAPPPDAGPPDAGHPDAGADTGGSADAAAAG